MFALIPHPTEALILSRTQKATLSRLNAEAGKPCWVPVFPLWAFFNNFDCRVAERDTAKKKQTHCAQDKDCERTQNAYNTDCAQIVPYDTALKNVCNEDAFDASYNAMLQSIGDVNSTFDTAKLKTIHRAIASFTIDAPEMSNGEFFFPAALYFRNDTSVYGKILAGKIYIEETAGDTKRSEDGSLCDDKKEAPLRAVKKTSDNADAILDAEPEEKSFGRFPYSCRVFRIADAKIDESKAANGETAGNKIADKRSEDTSANTGDTDGMHLRAWHVNTSLWVKI
ncbi:hypothetical protein [Treponema sp. Marseille-Q4130]|uniref:hypothetical protein n=1 Tax=Treponema sp. Marseille-Q4130 TaxID=2766702 RepID=UPI0016529B67|nr:hypothetical protein [Treponema sp. Marseille-Q4130]MBC6721304.1 hypothetical protein [Treponema sp. Marseille-Q4130]